MTEPSGQALYRSYSEFYSQAYGQYVTVQRNVGSLGVTLIEAAQTAGDWSDAPTPDLSIGWLVSKPVSLSFDLGAGRRKTVIHAGQMALTAPFAATSLQLFGAHVVRAMAVRYDKVASLGGERGDALPRNGDFGHLHADLLQDAALGQLLHALWTQTAVEAPHTGLLADGLMLQVLARLVELQGRAVTRHSGGLSARQLRQAQEALEELLPDEVSLAGVSALVHLSPAHFSRAFKVSTGLPPWRWLAERRIERAKTLLEDPSLSLTDVAQMVGYSGQSTFGEAFRRATGVTLGQYRRAMR